MESSKRLRRRDLHKYIPHLFESEVPTKKPWFAGHMAIEVTAPISSHCFPTTYDTFSSLDRAIVRKEVGTGRGGGFRHR